MPDDPYATLGIARNATVDEVRRAYRSMAKKSHPDLHPGDKAAEARFKQINAANDILSDPDKRGRFDRGEIDSGGQPVPERAFYRDYAQSEAGQRYRGGASSGAAGASGFEGADMNDMFGAFFREQANGPRAGQDLSYRLDVAFLDSVNGSTERLTLPDGSVLDVRIPPGLLDGQVLRLRGKGDPGRGGGPDGDALIEVSVFPHALYRRDGADLVMDLPVSFREAVLGARVEVPTPRGRVTLGIPARSEAGARLRLRGRGVAAHGSVAAGDLYVTLVVVAGPADAALETFLQEWTGQEGFDPRAAIRAAMEEGA